MSSSTTTSFLKNNCAFSTAASLKKPVTSKNLDKLSLKNLHSYENYMMDSDIKLFKHSSFYAPVFYKDAFSLGFRKKKLNNRKVSLVWVATQINTLQLALNINYYIIKQKNQISENFANYWAWFFPIVSNETGFFSHFSTARTLLAKSIAYNLFSVVVKFVLVGYNYKASYEKGILSLAIGYSHFCSFLIPHGVFIKVLNKRNIRLYSFNFLLLTQIAAFLKKLKKVSPFTGKGLLSADIPFKLKKRSG